MSDLPQNLRAIIVDRSSETESQMHSNDDDYYRYIEYLQLQTLDEVWAPAFDASTWKDWVVKNRERLEKSAEFRAGADGPSLVADFERTAHGFNPTTRFELPTTKPIFEPILSDVSQTVAKLGIRPVRAIEVATSTDSCASPMSPYVHRSSFIYRSGHAQFLQLLG